MEMMSNKRIVARQLSRLKTLFASDDEIKEERLRLLRLSEEIFRQMEIIYSALKDKIPISFLGEYGTQSALNKALRKIEYYGVLKRQFDTVNRLVHKHFARYRCYYQRQRMGYRPIENPYFDGLIEKYGCHEMGGADQLAVKE